MAPPRPSILEAALNPALLRRLAEQFKARGISSTQAMAEARAELQRFGILDSRGQLTDFGKVRQGVAEDAGRSSK